MGGGSPSLQPSQEGMGFGALLRPPEDLGG